MKVLLFVQTGDGRPKCVARGASAHLYASKYSATNHISRWWLVECENAEAGRAVIKLYGDFGGEAPVGAVKRGQGRVLASGGKP